MTRHRSIAAPSACLLASSLVLGQEVQAQLAGNALMFDGTNFVEVSRATSHAA